MLYMAPPCYFGLGPDLLFCFWTMARPFQGGQGVRPGGRAGGQTVGGWAAGRPSECDLRRFERI